jgi:Lon protease-like protein
MDDALLLTGFSGNAPIFALPSTVFFPGARLPLHVFESRYRALVKNALQGDRLVAVALLKPGWEADYQGNPPIHEVCTVGRIIAAQAIPDGRYLIVLEGLWRFHPTALVQEKPYRIAKGRVLADVVDPISEAGVAGKALRLSAVLSRLAELNAQWKDANAAVEGHALSPGKLADVVAAAMPVDPEGKQRLLEVADVDARLSALVAVIGKALSAALEPEREGDADGAKWN